MENNFNNTKKNSVDILSNPAFSSTEIINSRRDWCILILLFVIFIISVSIFDFSMYRKTVSGDMYVSVQRNELTIEDLKIDNIEKVLKIFEDKKDLVNTLKIEKVVDPSL